MTREPVLFRVDGTRATGWEGLARCLGLAYALQRRRRPGHFLARLEPGTLAGAVKRGGNDWIEADAPAGTPEDLQELIQEVRRIRPAAVVVDAPGCGPEYLAELVTLGPLVVSVDTAAGHRFPSQLVINPSLNVAVADYDVCPGTQVLNGRRYALVRPEIRRIRPSRAQEPPEPFRVLVALGDDPNNQTLRFTKLLMNLSKVGKVDIIARPQHPELPKYQELAEAHKGQLSVATEAGETAFKVARCHLALCEANSWALEFACVGVPMLVVVQDEAYWPTAQRLEDEGAATCLGWHEAVTDATVKTAVQTLLGDSLERRAMARAGRALIDGRGPDRLVTALEVLLHPSRQVDLREAA
jgi:spore coat polysaccharide biosynthesis predicted glycosyltransferase SpsG